MAVVTPADRKGSGSTRQREDQLFPEYRGVECRVYMILPMFRGLSVAVGEGVHS